MGSATEPDVRAFVLETLAPRLSELGLEPNAVPDDFDLLAGDVVDSLGLLELLTGLEERFGVELDFEDAEPEEITRLDAICRRVSSQSA